jgi:hypothetical protein
MGRSIPQVASQAGAGTPEVILLLGDGEETWETPQDAFYRASTPLKKSGLPLYALCLGKEDPQPVAPPPGARDEMLFSRAHPEFLKALASATGGRLLGPGDDLNRLFQDLAQGKQPMPMRRSLLPAHPEAGAWLALAGICLWLLAAGKPMRAWRPLILGLALALSGVPSRAGVPLPQGVVAWLAQSALERGDLEAARKWKPRGDAPTHRLIRAEIELRSKSPAEALETLGPLTGQGAPRPLPAWRAPALLLAARAEYDLDRVNEARTLLERALLEDPGRSDAIHDLQTILRDPGKQPPNPKKPPPPPPSQAARQDEQEGLRQRLPPKPPGGVKDL